MDSLGHPCEECSPIIPSLAIFSDRKCGHWHSVFVATVHETDAGAIRHELGVPRVERGASKLRVVLAS